MLLRVTASQIVLDLYEKIEGGHNKTAEEFIHDVNIVYDYLRQDMDSQEKGATVSPLRPV